MAQTPEQLRANAKRTRLEKKCAKCKEYKPVVDFYNLSTSKDGLYSYCKACHKSSRKVYKDLSPSTKAVYKATRKVWLESNPEKAKATRQKHRLWAIFRLTLEDREKINSFQGGVCAISGRPPKTYALSVDHDHKTGKIRGLLTAAANRGLAMFNDDPVLLRKAADYLEKPPAVSALGREVFGVIGRGKQKKVMIYGSPTGPIKTPKKAGKKK